MGGFLFLNTLYLQEVRGYSALPAGEPSGLRLFLGYALLGTGLGWVNAATTNTAVSGMPREQAGVAAAVASTSRQLGSALGVAIIGSVIADHVTTVAAGPAFTSAQRVSWAIIAFCGLIALTVGGLTTGAWGRRRAKLNAERMQATTGADESPAAAASLSS